MTLRIGLLGDGMMAGIHAERLINMGDEVEVVALSDLSADITEAFAAKYFTGTHHVPSHYTDAQKMYDESNLDGVIVCTPHTLHYAHAGQALDADVHILLEKPMVTSIKDAYALRDRATQSDKTFIIGYNSPCTPVLALLKKIITDQRFGNLQMVNGYLTQNWMRGTTGTWRQDPRLSGGGQAYDSGAHSLCSLVWSVASSPKLVSAFIETYGCEVDINSVINIRFENDVLASVTVNGNCASATADMVFIFDKGRVRIDPWAGQRIQAWDKDEQIDLSNELGATTVTPTRHFVDLMQGKSAPTTSAENGVHQSELMDAIYASAKLGRAVMLAEVLDP